MKLARLDLGTNGDGPSLMPALLGITAAILLWYAGEELHAKLPPVVQQLKTAAKLVQRGSTQELSTLKRDAADARTQRAAIEFRLRSDDTEQMARARLVFELRQKCATAKVAGCSVRLSDETTATRVPAAVDTNATSRARREGEMTLESLGIAKARAVISGTFQGDEIIALSKDLQTDGAALWRINGLIVRGNTFELDVERHLRQAILATAPSRP